MSPLSQPVPPQRDESFTPAHTGAASPVKKYLRNELRLCAARCFFWRFVQSLLGDEQVARARLSDDGDGDGDGDGGGGGGSDEVVDRVAAPASYSMGLILIIFINIRTSSSSSSSRRRPPLPYNRLCQ